MKKSSRRMAAFVAAMVVVTLAGAAIPGQAQTGAACWRTLLPDGTVSASVVLGASSNGHAVTEEDPESCDPGAPICRH
jgi:hypothetical protein